MADKLYHDFSNWFWAESFWFPKNITWKDLERDDSIFLPQPRDLWTVFPVAAVLFVARLCWERYLAYPVGRYFSLRETRPSPPIQCEVLENAFKKYKKILPTDGHTLTELAKKVDMSSRQVERWWRRRRVKGKPSEMQRFTETSWRFLYYIVIFYYGVYVLWDKPWFWDTRHCWYGFPRQHVSPPIYWYYMISLGFYWSLIFSLLIDNKRKDFFEMIIHHIATILLLTMSYGNNMVRVGTLVLVVHDAVDYILEGAKMCKYFRWHKICDGLFVVFTVMWFITRLVIYPFRVLRSSLFESREIIGPYQSHTIFNGLLSVLQILHIIWFCIIMRMFKAYVLEGKIQKDERSESEPDSGSDEELQDQNSLAKGDPIKSAAANNNIQTNGYEAKKAR